MANGSTPPAYLANRYCDLCNLRIDRLKISYSVNFLSRSGDYTINEMKVVCRDCYLKSDRISRLGALK